MVKISEEYRKKYKQSILGQDQFWQQEINRLTWFKKPTIIKNADFKDSINIKWFEDGLLNVCYNCVDRHIENGYGDKIAFIWQGDDFRNIKKITYQQLLEEISIFANILENFAITKGDNVIIYMPMIPEAIYAMLACARIGAVHSVVFAGFSAQSLSDRIKDCKPKIIITGDYSLRGGKIHPLKDNVDQAQLILKSEIPTIVIANLGKKLKQWHEYDFLYNEERLKVSNKHSNIAQMQAEDPFFILYTSGSTGKPKGLVHSTAGYLLYVAMTFEISFNYQENDIFWCTADIGWITGHSYGVYGPLANCATNVLFEGMPNYPTPARLWQEIDKHKVNIFYTAPTAIRALMKEGDKFVKGTSRKSLKVLGTVGEPINPEAWQWYNDVVGEKKCYIVDTWWQTETGGHMIVPIPKHIKAKPSFATLPMYGVEPVIVDDKGEIILGEGEGNLCIKNSWPGQARTIFNDHNRFIETYFSLFPGLYFTGDGAKRTKDGYYKITGRVDDVLNISGHRISTAEIEAALNKHDKVCESAIVGMKDEIKGEAIYAFVILNNSKDKSIKIKKELKDFVRKEIGALAIPKIIHFTEDLPKTRSGKIMRRIIRKIANGEIDQLGDLSSLINPEIIKKLIIAKDKLN